MNAPREPAARLIAMGLWALLVVLVSTIVLCVWHPWTPFFGVPR